MLIGNQYADHKLYRGIRHFDNMPLTSEDIHEHSDTAYMKNAYIMNNLLGYGTLNTPSLSLSVEGLSLDEPSIVMIDGDIFLVQSDEGTPLCDTQSVLKAGHVEGVACILGWYQYISSGSSMRNYGGIDNSEIENDLWNEELDVQVSGRYQFRWMPVYVSKSSINADSISINILPRDIYGDISSDQEITIHSIGKKDTVFILESPEELDYIETDMYLIPLIEYKCSTNLDTILAANLVTKMTAGAAFIVSDIEPIGIFPDGTEWYNPTTREFRTYIRSGGGFVASASKMAFLQYQSVHMMVQESEVEIDVEVPINISGLVEGDILQVIYEGAILVLDEHYTVDYEKNTITLLGFTPRVDDHVYFNVTKIVDATAITDITKVFSDHLNLTSSETVVGHTKLTDTLSNSDATQGIAATPKLVKTVTDNLATTISNNKTSTDNLIQATKTSLESSVKSVQDSTTSSIRALESNMTQTLKNFKDEVNQTVSENTTIPDASSGTAYRLGIENGVVFLEEVE